MTVVPETSGMGPSPEIPGAPADDVVISADNVSKMFKAYVTPWQKLRDALFPRLQGRLTELWALRDVSVRVSKGEVVGLIGGNGSGKTTLLRVLCGALEPTAGSVSVKGRISNMSELTAGFHQEFSGRLNANTKGRLLGFSPDTVDALMPKIIAFAGLSKHIDRPVKTYSSGMVARLAFSTIVHLDCDIYFIDEVLAVGDRTFQKKCLHTIRGLQERGKTVIVSSHSLGNLGSICRRIILLDEGRLLMDGPTEDVFRAYYEHTDLAMNRIENLGEVFDAQDSGARLDQVVAIRNVDFLDAQGEPSEIFDSGSPMTIRIELSMEQPVDNPLIRIQMYRNDGVWVCGSNNYRNGVHFGVLEGSTVIEAHCESMNLLAGDYYVSVGVWPDECTSLAAKTPYALHDRKYVLHVASKREDGGGLARLKCIWEKIA